MEWLPKFSKLDTEQQDVIRKVRTYEGNHFITGYPGTGKSVVLAHAALESNKACAILTYTNALVACIQEGIRGVNPNADISVQTIDQFVDYNTSPKELLLIDEAQDLGEKTYYGHNPILPTLQTRAVKLIFAADKDQSIYSKTLPIRDILASCSIKNDQCHTLRINYRMTQATLNVLKALFPEKINIEVATGSLVEDVKVSRVVVQSDEEENQWIYSKAKEVAAPGRPSVILFEKHSQLQDFAEKVLSFDSSNITKEDKKSYGENLNNHFQAENLPVRFLGNGVGTFADSNEKALVYLMTCHSAKGLDFENVFVPKCESFRMEDNLFYVALSRSRRRLFLSGRESAWMHKRLENNPSVTKIVASEDNEDEDLF